MSISIPKIKFPELFFGFVAPIGADLTDTLAAFRAYFTAQNYKVIELKVTDIFQFFKNYCPPTDELKPTPLNERYETHIQYGNQLRETLGDDVLASSIIYRISNRRVRRNKTIDDTFSRTAYLLSHFKRKEEIDLLRSIYGQLFFQVSVYSRRGARIDYLSRGFANSQNSAAAQSFRAHAEAICQRDEDEVDKPHGQRVAKIFHDADFIVSLDSSQSQPTVREQVYKFCDLIFSSNAISPREWNTGYFWRKQQHFVPLISRDKLAPRSLARQAKLSLLELTKYQKQEAEIIGQTVETMIAIIAAVTTPMTNESVKFLGS